LVVIADRPCFLVLLSKSIHPVAAMEVEAESSSLSATVGQQQPPLPPAAAAETTTTETPPIQQMELPPPLRASELQPPGPEKKLYWDRSHYDSPESQMLALTKSSSLYVGNLSFTCRTIHVRTHFEQLGPVKDVIMGLDRNKKTPCGFCFVEYYDRHVALQAVSLLTGTKLDGNIIRVELDAGYKSGREYGRGMSGGQVRDDRRDRGRTKRPRASGGGLYGPQNNAMGSPEVKMDAALPSARDVSSGQFFGPTGTSTMTNSNNRIDDNNDDSGPATKMEVKEEDNTEDQQDQQYENAQEGDHDNDDEDRPAAKRQKT
jgi:nuclear cap-binding protein subunit 2